MQNTKTKITVFMIVTFVAIAITAFLYVLLFQLYRKNTIKVGILHSQTGTMAISEQAVIKATLLAIEEINNNNGILGKHIEPIIADGRSDPLTFYANAETLIVQEHVDVIFGCWTSASRKAVKPIIERLNNLMFYPVQYEGLEISDNIIYTGATANQQIIPAISWCFYNIGKKFYLVGSDYIFPRVANELIKNYATVLGATIVGEAYQPLNGTEFDTIIEDIIKKQPDIIINTINGSSNLAFFKKLRQKQISAEKTPTISFSISQEEFETIGIKNIANDYLAANYFQSIKNAKNDALIKAFKKQEGADPIINEAMEAAYFGVKLWAQTVQQAQTSSPDKIKDFILGQGLNAPEGIVYIEEDNKHTWKTAYIGKIQNDGSIKIVWSSEKPIRPIPFPLFNDYNWVGLLKRLYKQWDNKWNA